jgi:hypothetical protein
MIIVEVLWVTYFSHVKHITIKTYFNYFLQQLLQPEFVADVSPQLQTGFMYVKFEVHTAATVKSTVF